MLTNETRTVEEGYVSACNADDLTLNPDKRRPTDYLIAAGMARNMFGGALMRLRSEWVGMSCRGGDETDAILLFDKLKTLPTVLAALHEWLINRGHDAADTGLAGKIVAYWLDDSCKTCFGRGYALIPGTPITGKPCKHCHGSGKRAPVGGSLGRWALNMMDEAVHTQRRQMQKRLQAMRR